MDNRGNSRADACVKNRLLGRVVLISYKPTRGNGATGQQGDAVVQIAHSKS